MKIDRIEAIPFRVPLKKPVTFAKGRIEAFEHVLLRIRTADGAVGLGEVSVRPMIYGESQRSVVTAVEDWFAPAIIGLQHDDIEECWRRMSAVPANVQAKAAIDVALHDLIGKAAGVPLHRLLGAYRTEVEACHILGTGAPSVVAAEAVEMKDRYGLRWFKLKGGLNPAEDTAVIAAVRSAVGPDVNLTMDCNGGYSSQVAERTLPQWEEYDLAWIEEPCASEPVGRARVARACRTPLMLDESAYLPADVMREVREESFRVVALKLARTGITQSRKVLHLAEAAGLQVVVGSQADTEIGTLASVHFAAAHHATSQSSAELTFFLAATDRITEETLEIVDGRITVPQSPGLGARIDEGRLSRLRLDGRAH